MKNQFYILFVYFLLNQFLFLYHKILLVLYYQNLFLNCLLNFPEFIKYYVNYFSINNKSLISFVFFELFSSD